MYLFSHWENNNELRKERRRGLAFFVPFRVPLGVVVVDSVFFDFRVYKGSVNTEIKEHRIIICRFEAQLR